MRCWVAILAVVVLAGADNPNELLGELRSTSRVERIAAARKLAEFPELPESSVDAILGFIKREVDSVTTPPGTAKGYKFTVKTEPPDVGEIVTFTRIKGTPGAYFGRDFVMAGGIKIDNYYNFGFAGAAGSHYSFSFTPFNPDGSLSVENEGIYMLRGIGTVLAETMTRSEEKNGNMLAIRLKCKIDPGRCQGDVSNALHSIEVVDWQFSVADGKGWMPWAYEGIFIGCRMLFLTGKPSIPKCLDLILAENEYQSEKADLFLRTSVIFYLSKLPRTNRILIAKQIQNRVRRVKSERVKAWARRASSSVSMGVFSW